MSYDEDEDVGGGFKMSASSDDELLDDDLMSPDGMDFGEDGEIDPDGEK